MTRKQKLLSSTAGAKEHFKEREPREREPRFEPLVVSIRDTMHLLNSSRTDIHRKIRAGRLRAIKDGARTKVVYASVKALVAERATAAAD